MLGHEVQFMASNQIPNTYECACPMHSNVQSYLRARHACRRAVRRHAFCMQAVLELMGLLQLYVLITYLYFC
jgi:hypothetical protein